MKTCCFCVFPEPPSLEDAGKILNETVVVNNPIHLECRASGNPLPGIRVHLGKHLIKGFTFMCLWKVMDVLNVELCDFKPARDCVMGNVSVWAYMEEGLRNSVIPTDK